MYFQKVSTHDWGLIHLRKVSTHVSLRGLGLDSSAKSIDPCQPAWTGAWCTCEKYRPMSAFADWGLFHLRKVSTHVSLRGLGLDASAKSIDHVSLRGLGLDASAKSIDPCQPARTDACCICEKYRPMSAFADWGLIHLRKVSTHVSLRRLGLDSPAKSIDSCQPLRTGAWCICEKYRPMSACTDRGLIHLRKVSTNVSLHRQRLHASAKSIDPCQPAQTGAWFICEKYRPMSACADWGLIHLRKVSTNVSLHRQGLHASAKSIDPCQPAQTGAWFICEKYRPMSACADWGLMHLRKVSTNVSLRGLGLDASAKSIDHVSLRGLGLDASAKSIDPCQPARTDACCICEKYRPMSAFADWGLIHLRKVSTHVSLRRLGLDSPAKSIDSCQPLRTGAWCICEKYRLMSACTDRGLIHLRKVSTNVSLHRQGLHASAKSIDPCQPAQTGAWFICEKYRPMSACADWGLIHLRKVSTNVSLHRQGLHASAKSIDPCQPAQTGAWFICEKYRPMSACADWGLMHLRKVSTNFSLRGLGLDASAKSIDPCQSALSAQAVIGRNFSLCLYIFFMSYYQSAIGFYLSTMRIPMQFHPWYIFF